MYVTVLNEIPLSSCKAAKVFMRLFSFKNWSINLMTSCESMKTREEKQVANIITKVTLQDDYITYFNTHLSLQ
jgi:hypothetical protein